VTVDCAGDDMGVGLDVDLQPQMINVVAAASAIGAALYQRGVKPHESMRETVKC
jgi:hypothetical protein